MGRPCSVHVALQVERRVGESGVDGRASDGGGDDGGGGGAKAVSTATGNLRNGDPGGNGGSAGEHGADRGGADAEVVLTEVALAEGGAGTR